MKTIFKKHAPAAIALFICACISMTSHAQQDVLTSQYMFNHMVINPAYAGTKQYTSSQLIYRRQWANLEGAPETQIGSVHGEIGATDFGWGALLCHDHIGATDRTDVFANGAYHLRINDQIHMSVGLRMGGSYFSCNNADLKYWDQGDQVFDKNRVSGFLPNAGTGIFMYAKRWYGGLSVPTIISYDKSTSLSADPGPARYIPSQVRHYYATGGYVYELSQDVLLKPGILLKYVDHAPLQADFNLNVLLQKVLWVGASYRTGDALVGLIEFQASQKIRIGYSYDLTFSPIRDCSSGSHEFMLGYDFGRRLMQQTSPSYF